MRRLLASKETNMQSAKKTAVVAAATVAKTLVNGTVAALKYADTLYYQVDKHGDYTQETN